ncbi:ABC-2 type transport system permease protein [Parafrankia irregularis]|uniref:ABC-2 type transport system permease protein n=2 Tax=Parafrankia irregularis TaxID=795642 RepID=A0A0S4QLP1_9ACTN|nr:ABC-2 family transporter protein [Parafrankia sp. CH37]CUU55986.1 ABC-2 type transport system permease protein [Parafrankia irregularis]
MANDAGRMSGGARSAAGGGRLGLVRDEAALYLLLVRAAFRSAAQYRVSLVMYTLVEMAGAALDLATIGIIFAHLPDLDGFALSEVAFLYGSSALPFALAEALVGPLDQLGWQIKDGRMDATLTRPVSVLVQSATMDFSAQRLGRLAQPAAVFAVSLAALPVDWSPGRVAILPMMVLCGTVISISLAVGVAAVLFVAPDASVAIAAVRQGSALATQYPLTIYGRRMAMLLTFVFPVAFVNWQPALFVLGRPDPFGLPGFTGFLSPLVALASCLAAGIAWSAGIRHYRGEGG